MAARRRSTAYEERGRTRGGRISQEELYDREGSGQSRSGRSGNTRNYRRRSAGSAGRTNAGGRTGRTSSGQRRRRSSGTSSALIVKAAGTLIALLLASFLISRCGRGSSGTYTESTAEFSRGGAVTVTSVESFDKDYYSSDELRKDIDDAVSSFAKNGGSVKLVDYSVKNKVARVVLRYGSTKDYTNFNSLPMFYGKVSEAQSEGYDLSAAYSAVSTQDSSKILTKENIADYASSKVAYITEKMDVAVPGKILFVSANLQTDKDDMGLAKAVDTVSEKSPGVVIFR
ncbi:MAG: hypothetical protein PUC46_05295 [Lachnospiraceae bacterium]|nr:hypothetical protein [Lachnospiraceae bacterium]